MNIQSTSQHHNLTRKHVGGNAGDRTEFRYDPESRSNGGENIHKKWYLAQDKAPKKMQAVKKL